MIWKHIIDPFNFCDKSGKQSDIIPVATSTEFGGTLLCLCSRNAERMDATCRISRPNCSLPALPGRSLRYENGNGKEIIWNDDDHFTLLNDEQISNKGWAPTSECKSYGLIDLLQIHFLWSFKFKTKFELYCLYSRPLIVLQHAFFCLNPMCVFSPWRRIPPPNRTKKQKQRHGPLPTVDTVTRVRGGVAWVAW